MFRSIRPSFIGSLAVALLVAACGGSTPTAAPPASTGTGPSPAGGPTALTVGLGYIPSVQFAQFYLAEQRRATTGTPGST